MSGNDDDNSLDALFADALKAMDNIKKESESPPLPEDPSDFSDSLEVLDEIELDFEIEEGIPEYSDTPGSEDLLLLQEEMAALEAQYASLRAKYKALKEENTRYSQRLASAHTHMQTMKEQRDGLRERQQQTQEALDNANTRAQRLEGTIERQKGQIEKNGALRRKERSEMQKYGASSTLQKLLPALDSLDLALKNIDADPESLKSGLRLVQNQFLEALESAGVQKLPAATGLPFNPNHHEAVMQVPSDNIPYNHIVEAFCGAYQLHDRLLRPAQVTVAAPKK